MNLQLSREAVTKQANQNRAQHSPSQSVTVIFMLNFLIQPTKPHSQHPSIHGKAQPDSITILLFTNIAAFFIAIKVVNPLSSSMFSYQTLQSSSIQCLSCRLNLQHPAQPDQLPYIHPVPRQYPVAFSFSQFPAIHLSESAIHYSIVAVYLLPLFIIVLS
jgi:hypothetical protein